MLINKYNNSEDDPLLLITGLVLSSLNAFSKSCTISFNIHKYNILEERLWNDFYIIRVYTINRVDHIIYGIKISAVKHHVKGSQILIEVCTTPSNRIFALLWNCKYTSLRELIHRVNSEQDQSLIFPQVCHPYGGNPLGNKNYWINKKDTLNHKNEILDKNKVLKLLKKQFKKEIKNGEIIVPKKAGIVDRLADKIIRYF
jgi:hypothetical protein